LCSLLHYVRCQLVKLRICTQTALNSTLSSNHHPVRFANFHRTFNLMGGCHLRDNICCFQHVSIRNYDGVRVHPYKYRPSSFPGAAPLLDRRMRKKSIDPSFFLSYCMSMYFFFPPSSSFIPLLLDRRRCNNHTI